MSVPGGAPGRGASTTGAPPALVPGLRWRRVFPGEERQLGVMRRWLASLLPDCPARDDLLTVATEYGANAVRHTASGRGGWFATEITWHGPVVRVAVADGGAPTGPQVIDDPMGERGRGLVVVRALAVRTGAYGDQRGRLVWADIPWEGTGAAVPAPSQDHEAAISDGEADLASRFAGVPAWFGRSTLQWWALADRNGLVTAPSARELSSLLSRMLDGPPRRPPPGRDTTRADATPARAAHPDQRTGAPLPRFPPPSQPPPGYRDNGHPGDCASRGEPLRTGGARPGLANVFAASPGPSLASYPLTFRKTVREGTTWLASRRLSAVRRPRPRPARRSGRWPGLS